MLINHYPVPVGRLTGLFFALLAIGVLLTLPLFRFDYRKFMRSTLCLKIIFWIPIFVIFVGFLYLSNAGRLTVLLVLIGLALRELIQVIRQQKQRQNTTLVAYFLLFAAALLHFYLIATVYKLVAINLLVTICFASVLADVTAFFMGNYLGRHKLPAALNKNKSWEGVSGQVIGAFMGVALVNVFVVHVVSLWLLLPIGIGSAAGDLANSYVKRKAGIKDWSENIPGHGGYLDRLSSLAGSAVFTFYYLKLTGLM